MITLSSTHRIQPPRCLLCHRNRYAERFQVNEWAAQHREYGPPCRCPGAPKMRDAFDELATSPAPASDETP